MKVALVHEWLTTLGGSERVVLELSRLFPEAPLYTSVHRKGRLPREFDRRDIRTTFLDRLPLPHQALVPLMPLAFEQLDLREFDLVISSSHACAKGVLTRADALHVSYCHTPMRYAWDLQAEYQQSLQPLMRPLSAWLLHRLRLWDFAAAQRVDRFVANSAAVAGRIGKWYRRPADILHPPVDLSRFVIAPKAEEPCLVVSRLVPYKRIDLAI
ncbi:MAG: glycosyltransferase, partial [Cyanobacteria bacterium REEB65]|nr:glycosyltransferase [Cyanobacteria bacterium REEB65]